ncbi:MAG: sugar phosphate isomerase/epimerase family protein [Vicinamibacterales bacterium]
MSWDIGIATGGCVERPILDVLDALADARVPQVEIGTPPRHFAPWEAMQTLAVRDHLQRGGMRAVSIHAPFGGLLDLSDPNPHHRRGALTAILTAAAALDVIGGRYVVVHPSDTPRHGHDVGRRLADCRGTLEELAAALTSRGLVLALETPLPHLIGGHPDEFAWLLETMPPEVAVCLDTGHTALGGHWLACLRIAGRRLAHVHATDNHGRFDDHLPPGDGALDWPTITGSLREAGYQGAIILELACTSGPLADYFKRAYEQAQRIFAG